MTVGLNSTVANGWLNTLRGGSSFTAIAVPYVKLHVGDPGVAGTSNAAAGSTTRVAMTQSAASGGSISMSGTAPVWTNSGTTETLTHVSVWDALTSGNFLYSGALLSTQAWVNGNTFTLTAFTCSLTPIAT